MTDTPRTRQEWLRALHFAPPDREARPASPQTTGDAGDERLLHALDHMRAIMIEVGSDGRPFFVSPTITTILGYSAEEITETPGWDFVHEEDRELFARAMESHIEG